MTEAITPIFNYNFTGNIWKIYFDKIKNLLILEIRNADIFQASFACIDLNINTLVFEDLKMSQNWWLGISEVQDGIIFFHFFPDSQKPEAKEILAFDIFKQRPLWHSAIHRFEQIESDYLLAWRWQEGEKIYEKLDLQTGKILDSPSNTLPLSRGGDGGGVSPIQYKSQTPYFETLSNFLKKILKIEILQALDYLEYEDWVIIAYFSKKNEEIQNNLLVLDTNAQILLHKTINKSTEGIGLETFLIIDQKLLVIEEKTRLITYQLKK